MTYLFPIGKLKSSQAPPPQVCRPAMKPPLDEQVNQKVDAIQIQYWECKEALIQVLQDSNELNSKIREAKVLEGCIKSATQELQTDLQEKYKAIEEINRVPDLTTIRGAD
jgi:hypothetical protein